MGCVFFGADVLTAARPRGWAGLQLTSPGLTQPGGGCRLQAGCPTPGKRSLGAWAQGSGGKGLGADCFSSRLLRPELWPQLYRELPLGAGPLSLPLWASGSSYLLRQSGANKVSSRGGCRDTCTCHP